MTFRIVTETNGLGEVAVFVEVCYTRQVRSGGFFPSYSTKVSWERCGNPEMLGHELFESVESAKKFIDVRAREAQEAVLRNTIVKRTVVGYP